MEKTNDLQRKVGWAGEVQEELDTDDDDTSAASASVTATEYEQLSYYLDQCQEDLIITDERKKHAEQIHWKDFLEELNQLSNGDTEHKKRILERTFTRTVTVPKDGANNKEEHRRYHIQDTILEKALRRLPPAYVLDEFATLSPTYNSSKTIFDIINIMPFSDTDWVSVKECLYDLLVANKMGLTDDEKRRVFKIRHTWREDTLLMVAVRRNPPVKVIEIFLAECRDAIAIVDTPLYDWIPMIYAIAYSAKPQVIELLIPTEDDYEAYDNLKEFNFLGDLDVYNRTPFHWTVFYDSHIDTIHALKRGYKASQKHNETADDVLAKGGKGNRPFELAISTGTSFDIIGALIPDSIDEDYSAIEMSILLSFLYKRPKELETAEESQSDIVARDVYIGRKFYNVSKRLIPYLAKHVEIRSHLQDVVMEKSCQTIATAVFMLKLYAMAALILTFRVLSIEYLTAKKSDSAPPTAAALTIFFLANGYLALLAFSQIYVQGIKWFLRVFHLIDLASIILMSWCGIIMATVPDDDEVFPVLCVVSSAVLWTSGLVFLRNSSLRFAIFVSGLSRILRDIVPFVVVSMLVLVAFSEMYMLDKIANDECIEDGDEFCSIRNGVFTSYEFFVYGVENMQEFATRPTLYTITVVYGFIVTVILLSVIIAIVGNSWDKAADEGREAFWNFRLWFLHTVKNYEELNPSIDGRELKSVARVNGAIDSGLHRVAKRLWPRRNTFWGNFDTTVERIFSTSYGSLIWQFNYDLNVPGTTPSQRLLLKLRTVMLFVLAFSYVFVWFLLGACTAGILWPASIRRFLFSKSIEHDKTDAEEVGDDIDEILEIVKKDQKRQQSIISESSHPKAGPNDIAENLKS